MASYNEGLHWTGEQGMGSWGSGGTDYCNFGYSNVSRNGTTVSFNWDTYIRQSTSQNYDRWAMTSNQLGVSNGTIKGHGSSWSQYPLGYYNYSNNNGASSTGGANSYGSAKSASVTVPLGQNYVDISVTYKNTGLNDGWVTPYGDSSTYPDVTKTFRISGVPLGTYTVSYNANGGTGAPGNQTKTHGTNLTLSSTRPTKANTTTSWSCALNANGGTSSTTSVSATATLVWSFRNWLSSSDNNTYNPGGTYSNNANTTMTAQWDSTGSATYTLPQASVFTKTGYTCIGFDSDPTATTPTYAPSDTVSVTANGGTLYAIYEANTYTVSYDANGGTGAPASQSYTYATTGDITLSSSEPNRAGHIFSGWATTSTSTTVDYAAGDSYSRSIANDQILYAVWEDSPYNKIAINIDGGLKTGTTYIKINNVWKIADEVFTKVSGAWKRAITPNPIPARLPDAYREVYGIQSTGTQFINTFYKPNQNTKTEISMKSINLTSTLVPFGTRANQQLDYILGINFNSLNYIQYNTNTAIYSTEASTDLLNTKFIASLDKTAGTITYIDSNTQLEKTITMTPTTTTDFNCNNNLYLGCLNNNGNTQYLIPSYILYYCKIWENNQLIRDFIPCYRRTDNKVGLYDLTNNVFYDNAGSGNFTIVNEGRLPNTYQEVEYIGMSGAQYIDTHCALWSSSDWKIELSFDVSQNYDYNNLFGFGAVEDISHEIWVARYGEYYVRIANLSTKHQMFTASINTRYDMVHDNTGNQFLTYVNGTQVYSYNKLTTAQNYELWFGHRLNGAHLKGKVYSLKFWKDGALVRDFVPCYRKSDNEIGLYDLVEDTFYTNQGSGSFTKGSDV